MEGNELEEKIDQIRKVIHKLKEKHSKKKIKWLMDICDPEFGLVESLIANFIQNVDQTKYATKILRLLRKLLEYVPEVIYDQLVKCESLPEALAKYIKITSLDNMTPDAFLLLTEFFKESEYGEILADEEFGDKLFEVLLIINKAEYFDAVCNIILVRFKSM